MYSMYNMGLSIDFCGILVLRQKIKEDVLLIRINCFLYERLEESYCIDFLILNLF